MAIVSEVESLEALCAIGEGRGVVDLGDARYSVDHFGVVHQDPPTITQVYDIEYVRQRYDSIPEIVHEMSFLRSGFIKGVVGDYKSILDVGYGNGDFLRTQRLWNLHNVMRFGTDISGYPIPEACTFLSWEQLPACHFDVACFFDSFEHVPDHKFMEWLNANWLVFTIPWFHMELGLDWFRQWKHRRPGEHIHHFYPDSLTRMLGHYGYRFVASQDLEDGIRRVRNGHENTFTAVYKR